MSFIAATIIGGLAFVLLVLVPICIWQTRQPPRNRRVSLPPPSRSCLRAYPDV